MGRETLDKVLLFVFGIDFEIFLFDFKLKFINLRKLKLHNTCF